MPAHPTLFPHSTSNRFPFSEELLKQLAESQKELVIPGPRKYYK